MSIHQAQPIYKPKPKNINFQTEHSAWKDLIKSEGQGSVRSAAVHIVSIFLI
jgi:hypothetical protein